MMVKYKTRPHLLSLERIRRGTQTINQTKRITLPLIILPVSSRERGDYTAKEPAVALY
jgi:hypothetical protein